MQKTAHEREQQHYRELIEEVGWFFLRILVFGYIEDIATGKSFHFPGELSWAIYIEVRFIWRTVCVELIDLEL